MRSAMKTLKQFSEKEREYHLYQSRQNAIRDELSKQRYFEEVERNQAKLTKDNEKLSKDVEEEKEGRQQAELKLEQERQNSKEALEALKSKLRAAGVNDE